MLHCLQDTGTRRGPVLSNGGVLNRQYISAYILYMSTVDPEQEVMIWSGVLFRFILKWIYLQSAFIKSPSIKEQRPLILITEDGEGRGLRLPHPTHRRLNASQLWGPHHRRTTGRGTGDKERREEDTEETKRQRRREERQRHRGDKDTGETKRRETKTEERRGDRMRKQDT